VREVVIAVVKVKFWTSLYYLKVTQNTFEIFLLVSMKALD
jgi:hypothetical protein